jgi:predicted dehydrogenase
LPSTAETAGIKEALMTGSLRWGILSTGGIAQQFTTDLLANGFTITAVGSRSQASADAFASRNGIATAHPSYESLAANPNVDIIYIGTPHPYHLPNALLVLGAGKHALIEKPFTLSAAEARQVVELAEQKKLVVLEAMWTRWLPHMIRLREIIAEGTIGDVRTVIADHNQKLSTDPHHRMNAPELGGGALLDLGIYPVSLAWDVLGKPQTIKAISSPTATGVDRQTAILFEYPDGQQALLHCALDTAGPNAASVIGTAGWVEIDRVFYTPTSFTVFNSNGNVVERFEQVVKNRGMQYQAWEAERLVATGQLSGEILPTSETVAIMESLDEIRAQIGLVYPGE